MFNFLKKLFFCKCSEDEEVPYKEAVRYLCDWPLSETRRKLDRRQLALTIYLAIRKYKEAGGEYNGEFYMSIDVMNRETALYIVKCDFKKNAEMSSLYANTNTIQFDEMCPVEETIEQKNLRPAADLFKLNQRGLFEIVFICSMIEKHHHDNPKFIKYHDVQQDEYHD